MNLRKADRRDRERRFEREMERKLRRKGAKPEASLAAAPEKKRKPPKKGARTATL
jgi:hypothetical protein